MKRGQKGKSKSQVSIEVLLLLVALAAFFSVFYQAYSQAQPKVSGLIASRAQELAFAQIISSAKQAEILGMGSKVSTRVTLLSYNNTLSFDNDSGTLAFSREAGNESAVLEQRLDFAVIVTNSSIGKGIFRINAEYASNAVKLSIEADSE